MMGVGKFISYDFKDLRPKSAYFVQDKDGYWRTWRNMVVVACVNYWCILRHKLHLELVVRWRRPQWISARFNGFDKDNGRKVKDTTLIDLKDLCADQSGVITIKSHSTQRNCYINDSEGNPYYVNDKGYSSCAHTIDNVSLFRYQWCSIQRAFWSLTTNITIKITVLFSNR